LDSKQKTVGGVLWIVPITIETTRIATFRVATRMKVKGIAIAWLTTGEDARTMKIAAMTTG
jgi:hypothetical protein